MTNHSSSEWQTGYGPNGRAFYYKMPSVEPIKTHGYHELMAVASRKGFGTVSSSHSHGPNRRVHTIGYIH
jgi:hypothetical protein